MDDGAKQKMETIDSKLRILRNRKAYKQATRNLMRDLRRTMRTGQRRTMPTAEEEKVRMKLTWQDFDYTQDMRAFCRDEIKSYVTNHEYWKKARDGGIA